jgi:GMP synthase PP-ATPase subunit
LRGDFSICPPEHANNRRIGVEDSVRVEIRTRSGGVTADYYPFEHSFLTRISTRIANEVRGVNRVVYDVTSKPQGTIEWE